jgi:hypothetical protein
VFEAGKSDQQTQVVIADASNSNFIIFELRFDSAEDLAPRTVIMCEWQCARIGESDSDDNYKSENCRNEQETVV